MISVEPFTPENDGIDVDFIGAFLILPDGTAFLIEHTCEPVEDIDHEQVENFIARWRDYATALRLLFSDTAANMQGALAEIATMDNEIDTQGDKQ